jgi:hypothetical protein
MAVVAFSYTFQLIQHLPTIVEQSLLMQVVADGTGVPPQGLLMLDGLDITLAQQTIRQR